MRHRKTIKNPIINIMSQSGDHKKDTEEVLCSSLFLLLGTLERRLISNLYPNVTRLDLKRVICLPA